MITETIEAYSRYHLLIANMTLLLLVVIIHELGHWVGFRLVKIRPKMQLKWWGILINGDGLMAKSVRQVMFVNYCGILTGFLVILAATTFYPTLFNGTFWGLIYIIMSGMDIFNIANYWKYSKSLDEPAHIVVNRYIKDITQQLKKDMKSATSNGA